MVYEEAQGGIVVVVRQLVARAELLFEIWGKLSTLMTKYQYKCKVINFINKVFMQMLRNGPIIDDNI